MEKAFWDTIGLIWHWTNFFMLLEQLYCKFEYKIFFKSFILFNLIERLRMGGT